MPLIEHNNDFEIANAPNTGAFATPMPPNRPITSNTARPHTPDGTSLGTTTTGGELEMRHFKLIIPILFMATYLEIVDSSAVLLFVLSLLSVTLLSWLVCQLVDEAQALDATRDAEIQQLRQERDEKAKRYLHAVQILDIVGERFEVAEEEIETLQGESNRESLQLQRAVTRIHARSRRLRAARLEINRLQTERDGALAANEAKNVENGRLIKELQDALEAKSRMEEDMLKTQGELILSSRRSLARDEGTVHGTETGPTSEVNCLSNPTLTFGLF